MRSTRLTPDTRCIASVLLAALAVGGCGRASVASEPDVALAPSAASAWVPALSARASSSLEAPARVLAGPEDVAMVSAPLTARVVRVWARPGRQVVVGEPLVDVVMPELIRAAGALRSAQIRLEVLEAQQARLKSLLAEKLALASDIGAVQGAIAATRAEREAARATLRAAGQADEAASSLLQGSGVVALRAPIAGTVVAVSAQLGQLREPASGAMVELAAAEAEPQIEARFASAPPADAEFEWIEPGRSIPLILAGVAPRAGALDGSRLVWLRAQRGGAQPAPGALGRVRMLAPKDWVVVPTRALHGEGGLHVEVQAHSGPTRSPVTLVQQSASEAVVTGLTEGTLIAADAMRSAHVHAP